MSPENWRLVDQLYNEVMEKPPEDRCRALTAAHAHFPSEVLAKVGELVWSLEEDEEDLYDPLEERFATPLGNHRPGGKPALHPLIPCSLRELADRHGYEIREYLGGGGQGWVYLAYDRRHDVMVALKTMRYNDAQRLMDFRREFLGPSDLEHPNLVRPYSTLAKSVMTRCKSG